MESLAALSPVLADAVWLEATHSDHHQFNYRVINSVRQYHTFAFSLGHVAPNELVKEIFYGSQWENPLKFNGLSSFYGSLSKDVAQNSVNVIDGEGNGGASIWLIRWSQTSLAMMTPRDGEVMGEDGLATTAIIPLDWRYVARVCNIGPHTDILVCMMRAILLLPNVDDKTFFYMNEATFDRIRDDCHLRYFRTVPIRIVPELRNDEPRVV